ncbi:MAG: RCC1 domain-containing protein [Sandaracinaceae bacterium]
MRARSMLVVALAALAVGCPEPRVLPQVVVSLSIAPNDSARARWLRLTALDSDGMPAEGWPMLVGVGDGEGQLQFPLTLTLTPVDRDPTRTWGVEAQLFFTDAEPIDGQDPDRVARANGGYVDGRVIAVDVRLEDTCPNLCGPGQTCYRGDCVGARVDVASDDPSLPTCGACQRGRIASDDCADLPDGTRCGCDSDVCSAGACRIGRPAAYVATAIDSTCATMRDENLALYCWGSNDDSAIALSGAPDADIPTRISTARWESLSLGSTRLGGGGGSAYGCGVAGDELRCWGLNALYRMGPFMLDEVVTTPTAVPGVGPSVSVFTGGAHTCVLLRSGELQCFGYNVHGQLGRGTTVHTESDAASVPHPEGRAWVEADLGHEFTCALDDDGAVYCWGNNDCLELGTPIGADSLSPSLVPRLMDPTNGTTLRALQITTGAFHTCARYDDGSIWCWGANGFGNLGVVSSTDKSQPVRVELDDARYLNCGSSTCCAMGADDQLACWGKNDAGQVGTGVAFSSQRTPTPIGSATGWIRYDNGASHSCAVRADGAVFCWGANDRGQLGLGHREERWSPTRVCIPTPTP